MEWTLSFLDRTRKFDSSRYLLPENTDQIPGAEIQKEKVLKIKEEHKQLNEDEVWCLIDKEWYEKWKLYVGFEDTSNSEELVEPPGPINNESLLLGPEELKKSLSEITSGKCQHKSVRILPDLTEGVDYVVVHEEEWEFLARLYGGGFHDGYAPTIARMSYVGFSGFIELDLFPLIIDSFVWHDKSEESVTEVKELRFPTYLTFEMVLECLRYEFQVDEITELRLWIGQNDSPVFLVEPEYLIAPLEFFGVDFLESYQFIIEKKEEEGEDIVPIEKVDFCTNSGTGGPPVVPGRCGLRNLGNTCYMNSALQCLSRTRCLRDYFVSNEYEKELNHSTNILDGEVYGEVASAFGEIMKIMWSGEHSVVIPRLFKRTLGKFKAQYAGYDQQDSSGVVSFLLDGLHEGLNRVTEKTYSEPRSYHINHKDKDMNTENIEEVEFAKMCWERSRKEMNNSMISEKFHGQKRDELRCPECEYTRVSFGRFSVLRLPIPGKRYKLIDITFVFSNHLRPMMKLSLRMETTQPRRFCIRDVRERVSRMIFGENVQILSEQILVCVVYNGGIYRVFTDDMPIQFIKDYDKVYAFELSGKFDHLTPVRNVILPIYETKVKIRPNLIMEEDEGEEDEEEKKSTRITKHQYPQELLDYPIMFCGEKKSGKEMYRLVYDHLSRFFKPDAREILMERTSGRIDLEKMESLFPTPTPELSKFLETYLEEMIKKEDEEEGEEEITDDYEEEASSSDDDEEEERGFGSFGDRFLSAVSRERDSKKEKVEIKETLTEAEKKEEREKYGHIILPSSVTHQQLQLTPKERKKARKDEVGEVDFDDPSVNKKYLFTIKYLSQAVKPTGRSSSSSMIEKLYFSDSDLLDAELPKHSRFATFSTEKKYHTKITVTLSDFMHEILDHDKLKNCVDHESVEKISSKYRNKNNTELSLQKCLEKYCQKEVLTMGNRWVCSSCNNKVQAETKTDLYNMPEILVIQLKRFSSFGDFGTGKIDLFVDYPLELDMRSFLPKKKNKVDGNVKYRLYGVIHHYGHLHGGHYNAYVLSPSKDVNENPKMYTWCRYDDENVEEMFEEGVRAESGYVLFYEAVGVDVDDTK